MTLHLFCKVMVYILDLFRKKKGLNLKTAVQDAKAMQDFDSESL